MKWQYANTVCDDRQRRLLNTPSFDAVIDTLWAKWSIVGWWPQVGQTLQLSNAKRPVFAIRITDDAFDVFFNSPVGYRGQYFLSPSEGIRQNLRCIACIQSDLTKFWASRNHAPRRDDWEMTPDLVSQSLVAPSAKLWLIEAGKYTDLDKIDGVTWDSSLTSRTNIPEVLNGRWEYKDTPGKRVPLLSGLLVMGAWQDERGRECVHSSKRRRACEISETGWS